MQKRLLNPLAVVGLSLSLGAFSAVSAAHAEPEKPSLSAESGANDQASQPASSQQTKQLSVKTITLPDGEERREDTVTKRKLPNKKLALTSTALFATGYVPTFIVAMANSKNTSGALYAPVVGPWIEIGKDTSPGNRALLTFSGILQGVGFLGVVSSFFIPESRTEKVPMLGGKRVSMAPAAAKGTYQLTAFGRF